MSGNPTHDKVVRTINGAIRDWNFQHDGGLTEDQIHSITKRIYGDLFKGSSLIMRLILEAEHENERLKAYIDQLHDSLRIDYGARTSSVKIYDYVPDHGKELT